MDEPEDTMLPEVNLTNIVWFHFHAASARRGVVVAGPGVG